MMHKKNRCQVKFVGLMVIARTSVVRLGVQGYSAGEVLLYGEKLRMAMEVTYSLYLYLKAVERNTGEREYVDEQSLHLVDYLCDAFSYERKRDLAMLLMWNRYS